LEFPAQKTKRDRNRTLSFKEIEKTLSPSNECNKFKKDKRVQDNTDKKRMEIGGNVFGEKGSGALSKEKHRGGQMKPQKEVAPIGTRNGAEKKLKKTETRGAPW